ncbi:MULTISPECIES: tetratricopeptide repeat protein [unclassified Bradyrhizobium]
MVNSGGSHLASPPSPAEAIKTGDVLPISGQERDLVCAISFVHLACGQSARALALLRLFTHEDSQDVDLLRILTYALISEGFGDEALNVLDRLDMLDEEPSSRLPLTLLRSHALRRAGRMDEARAVFKDYVSLRGRTAPTEQQ